jgi:hypothetical protein
MSNSPQITTQKLLETIGLQTVELNLYRAQINQLSEENQQLVKSLNVQKSTVEAEKA